jgi:CBS domain-containing protein
MAARIRLVEVAMTLREVCTREVTFSHPDEMVVEAARRMRDRHVGDVVVADSQRRPIGILTDRDIVVGVVAHAPDRLSSLTVGDVMTAPLVTMRATDSIEAALDIMRARGIRRLPIVGPDGQLEGIVTFDDLMRRLTSEFASLANLVASEIRHERQMRPAS